MISASSTSTFGFLCWMFGGAIAIGIAQVSYSWFTASPERGEAQGLFSAIERTWRTFLVELGALVVLTVLVWAVFVWRTVAYDHTGLRYQQRQNAERIAALEKEIEYRKHNLSTNDAVFPNLINMMQAFRGYKGAIGTDSCVVRYTAPPETEPLARVFAEFSIQSDNCPTFGPGLGATDPDEIADTNNGMVSDAIIFHAAREDRAANILFMELSNQIKLVRSYSLGRPNYQIPPGGYKHTVWLQFGDKVKWSSEVR